MSRVSLVRQGDLPEDYQAYLDEANMGELVGVPNIFRALGNAPSILRSYMLWSKTLWDECGVGPRGRELVILAVARGTETRYVWNQHVPVARNAGVTTEEIEAIGHESQEPFDEADAALIEYVTAVADRSVDVERTGRLRKHVDESTIVAVTALASNYLATAAIVDALAIDLEEPFVGWDLVGRSGT